MEKYKESHTKIINLKYQLQHGMKNLKFSYSSETVTEKSSRNSFSRKKQEIIDELKLKTQHINGISKNQKIHNKIIQRHLKRRMINKYLKEYLKKDIYLQKKDKIDNLIFNIVV